MNRLIKFLVNIVVIMFILTAFIYMILDIASTNISSDVSFWSVFKFVFIYVGGIVVVIQCIINLIELEDK